MNINRRHFLFGSVAATALAGCNTAKVGRRELKPGERLNFAQIGCGIMGRHSLQAFAKNPGIRCVAVCDCDRERVAEGKRLVDAIAGDTVCRTVADFREVLRDPAIDVVNIATPDHWHAYMAVEAMRNGKDVFCEKPLTFSIEEAVKLLEAEKKYARVFQVNAWQRSERHFRLAAMLVRNACFGKVRYVDANYGGGNAYKLGGPSQPIRFFDDPGNAATEGAPNPNVDWDMWLGPARWRPYSDQLAPRGVNTFFPMFWRFDDDFGTGYNGDWGAHHLDIAQWGLGMDRSGPYRIIRSDEPHSTDLYHGGRRQLGMKMVFRKDYGDVLLEHRPFGVWGTVFYCDDGIVAVNRSKIAVWQGTGLVKPDETIRKQIAEVTYRPDRLVASSIGKDPGTDPSAQKSNKLDEAVKLLEEKYDLAHAKVQLFAARKSHIDDFVESCFTRGETISPVTVGAHAAILCGLCNLSYVYDTGFDWDPETNTFANGTGDPAWLRRAHYRNGWDIVV